MTVWFFWFCKDSAGVVGPRRGLHGVHRKHGENLRQTVVVTKNAHRFAGEEVKYRDGRKRPLHKRYCCFVFLFEKINYTLDTTLVSDSIMFVLFVHNAEQLSSSKRIWKGLRRVWTIFCWCFFVRLDCWLLRAISQNRLGILFIGTRD